MADPKEDKSKSAVEEGWDEPAPAKPTAAKDPSSLALLARDLIPPKAPQVTQPEIKPVTDRKVQFPGVWITVRNWARRYAGKLRDLVNKHKMIAIAATGTVVVVVVIVVVVMSGGAAK